MQPRALGLNPKLRSHDALWRGYRGSCRGSLIRFAQSFRHGNVSQPEGPDRRWNWTGGL
jgi:hypothetical protein